MTSAAVAQTPDNAGVIEEVVVTGSRVERSGFETPTPVTVISQQELQNAGVTSVAQQLVKAPVFQGSDLPSGIGTSSQRDPAASYLNLRGMGANRTLILVNGRRHVPSSSSGVVNVNLIPFALVERVEVVTGGASAAYGSDAVAGVVNFITDRHFEGVKATVQGGVSALGDNRKQSVSLAMGRNFLDGKLNISFAGQYFHNGETYPVGRRDWGRDDWKILANPDYTPTNGEYRLIASPNAGFSVATDGGMILADSGPLRGIQFGPGGSVDPFIYGSSVGRTFMIGGSYDPFDRRARIGPIEITRKNVYGSVGYDISDNLSATFAVTVADTQGHTQVTGSTDVGAGGSITIQQDNAFLPEQIRQVMQANNIASFRMGRLNPEFGFIEPVTDAELQRYVLSFDGSFGDSWTWSAYGQHGKTRYHQVYTDNRNGERWNLAVDAVRAPDGRIVCRSTLTHPNNGCIPANVFGNGALNTTDVASYVLQNPYSTSWSEQTVASTSLTGEPFDIWAGPVSVATGAEWREEQAITDADAASNRGIFRVGNKTDEAGEYSVKEAFVETVVPLVKDASFARSLDLNAAARITDYSTSGSVWTWKVGISYEPFETVRLRAARSRDIRAPNIVELFEAGHLNSGGTVVDPATGIQYAPRVRGGGNRALQPEEADTLTYGIVWSPRGVLSGLRASVDVYTIDLQNAIDNFGSQTIVDNCFRGNASLCSLIERDATGAITLVNRPYVNLGFIKTSGVDLQLTYSTDLAAGNIDLRLLGTWVNKYEESDGDGNVLDLAGSVARPDLKVSARLTYTNEAFRFYAEDQYVPSQILNASYTDRDIAMNRVDSMNVVNMSFAYDFDFALAGADTTEVFFAVNNVFDMDPPIVPGGGVQYVQTQNALYDAFGRRFMGGVRVAF